MESDLSDPEVQYQIGLCYQRGEGVEQDGAKAEMWFRRAADQDHPEAKALLSAGRKRQEELEGITADNLPIWCDLAEKGDPEAQYQAGCWFLKNPNTQQEGTAYLEMAVAQGHPQACLTLGKYLLKQGQGERAAALLSRRMSRCSRSFSAASNCSRRSWFSFHTS